LSYLSHHFGTAAEVRNTSIALQAARVAVRSARDSRKLQEQLIGAELEKFNAAVNKEP
jgi:hypothetical protein